jgi:hypothetical protein
MFRRLSLIVVLIATLGVAAGPAHAGEGGEASADSTAEEESEESPKRKAIRELLEITGTPKLGLQIAKRIISQMKRSHPEVPEKFWAEFENEMNKKAFIEMIIPVYEKHFTLKDIEKLIEFYQTDVGKKYVEKLPKLTSESMQAGRQWGRRLGQKVVDKLRAKGYQ